MGTRDPTGDRDYPRYVGEAIGQTLPLAVAVAISPIGIIASVLMLTSGRGGGNGIAFLIGWFAGLAIFVGAMILLGRGAGASSGGEPAEWTSYAKIVLGLLLLVVAHRQRTKDRSVDGDPPKWMAKVDSLNPLRALALGAGLGAINPKNLVLNLGAAAAIAQTGTDGADELSALLAYSLIASLGAAIPVAIYYFAGERAAGMLNRLKDSMSRNNGVIMAVICVVIAAKLIGDGITTLSLF